MNVTAITAGVFHACALIAGGGVKCWGWDSSGQLGDGTSGEQRIDARDVTGLTSGVAAISAGGEHTCALTTGGGVKCWGDNTSGALGDGTTVSRATPVDVVGLGSGVAAISAGSGHTCALTTAGAVKCWGQNSAGELGDGTATTRLIPTDVPSLASGIAAISAGRERTCALTAGGAVKCWGVVPGSAPPASNPMPTDIQGLPSGVEQVVAGPGDVACAVTNAPAVFCWGANDSGQLGNGTLSRNVDTPVAVASSPSLSAVAPDNAHGCGLTTSGGVECWGANFFGQLGLGYVGDTQEKLPMALSAIGVTAGVAAIASGHDFSCALMTSGLVKCWGLLYLPFGGITPTSFPVPLGVPYTIGILGTASSQTVTFASIPTHDVNDAAFPVTASASSGMPVTVDSYTPGVCSVSGMTVNLVSVGTCVLVARQPGDAGTDAQEAVQMFRVSGATAAMAPRLVNISTRAHVGAGNDVVIAGFIVAGPEPKRVMITASGPSLSAAGIANPLANPRITLVSTLANDSNDDWGQGSGAPALQAIDLAPADPHEPAILATLAPGAYTAVVSGGTGVTVVSVFEIDQPAAPLINISTRAQVGTGEDVLIAGFVVQGPAPQKVAVTVAGPSLASAGITNPLGDPMLTLVRQSDGAVIATNDNWADGPTAADLRTAGFAPASPLEPGVLLSLDPGAYTIVVQGAANTTGVAVVGVFAAP